MRRARPALLLAGVLLAAVPAAAPAAGQELPGPPGGVEAGEAPPMAEAPRLFRVGLGAGAFLWPDRSGAATLDGGALLGLEVESRVRRFLGFRVGAAYGRSAAAEAAEATDLNQIVVELSALLFPAFGALAGARALPYGIVSLASVIHDPVEDGLATRSQGAFGFGLGVEIELSGPLGGRAEWQRYRVRTQDVFVPDDLTGTRRSARRLAASLVWRL